VAMKHWLFTCSPSAWPEVFDRLASHDLGGWSISAFKKEVAIGDKIALWVGGNVEPGIYMYAEISGLPKLRKNFRPTGPAKIHYVRFTNQVYFEENPITLDLLEKNKDFVRITKYIRQPHSTPARMSPENWAFLQTLQSSKSRVKPPASPEDDWNQKELKAQDREQKKIDRLYDSRPREREVLTKARIGQGLYRTRVTNVETQGCRVTKIKDPYFLIASHIKPWRNSNDEEKLDGNNGFLFAPHIDYLFDRGHISFTSNGGLLVSRFLDESVLKAFKLSRFVNIGELNSSQKRYLKYHRDFIFEKKHKKP